MLKVGGLVVVAAAVGLGVANSDGSLGDSELPCVVASEWVDSNPNLLPETYLEFSGFDVHFRRAIYRALSEESRAELWREHFDVVRSTLVLNQPQLEYLTWVEGFVPEAVVLGRDDAGFSEAEQEQVITSAQSLFSEWEMHVILSDLGNASAVADEPESPTAAAGGCECATGFWHDFCYWGHDCGPMTSCGYDPGSCGILWTADCDGICIQLPPT